MFNIFKRLRKPQISITKERNGEYTIRSRNASVADTIKMNFVFTQRTAEKLGRDTNYMANRMKALHHQREKRRKQEEKAVKYGKVKQKG